MRRDAPRLEDRLGPREPPYRSRGEAQLGRMLDHYGIPFVHEKLTPVYDRGRWRLWRPDFTLPSYGNLIVEYAGMPDRPDYMRGIAHKRRAYEQNNCPALFLYPADLTGPRWPEHVARRLEWAYTAAQPGRSRLDVYQFK